MNWQTDKFEDEFVKLVLLTEGDFETLFSVASDPLIWEQHPSRDRYKLEVFQIFFDEAIKSKTAFLILDKTENIVIGSTRYYDFQPSKNSIAIGYTFFARNYWGSDFNKRVKKLMINYAFQFVDKVVFHIGANNIRSQIATKRLGAIKTREYSIIHEGLSKENFEYEIVKKNWLF